VFVSFSVKSQLGSAPSGPARREPHRPERRVLGEDGGPSAASAASPAPSTGSPTTRYCGTRASAAGAASRPRPAVRDGDPDQDVVGTVLGVLDEDVEVAALVEDAGVRDLELRVGLSPARFSSTRRS
jgi:hypothetical protein